MQTAQCSILLAKCQCINGHTNIGAHLKRPAQQSKQAGKQAGPDWVRQYMNQNINVVGWLTHSLGFICRSNSFISLNTFARFQ